MVRVGPSPLRLRSRSGARALFADLGLEDSNGDGLLEDKAGRPVRFSVLTNRGNTIRERTVAVMQEQLRKVGVAMDVTALDRGAVIQRIISKGLRRGLFRHRAVEHRSGRTTSISGSAGGFHVWHMGQAKLATEWEALIDDLMRQQVATIDLAERQRLFAEVQRMLAENIPVIYVAAPRITVAKSPRLLNATPVPFRPPVLWNSESLAVRREARASRVARDADPPHFPASGLRASCSSCSCPRRRSSWHVSRRADRRGSRDTAGGARTDSRRVRARSPATSFLPALARTPRAVRSRHPRSSMRRPVSELVGGSRRQHGAAGRHGARRSPRSSASRWASSRRAAAAAPSRVVRGASVAALSAPPLLTSLALVLLAPRERAGFRSGAWGPSGTSSSPRLPWRSRVGHARAAPGGRDSETLHERFMLAAVARGLPDRLLLWRHSFRASLVPVLGVYAVIVGSLFSGSFAVEIVTSWPGSALDVRRAHRARHSPRGGMRRRRILLSRGGTLAADAALAWADPRTGESS